MRLWFGGRERNLHRNKRWQRDRLLIAEQRYPLSNDVGVDPVTHRDSGHGNAGLLAFLDDLGFEGFRVRLPLAHGDPGVKGNCVRLKNADTIDLIGQARKVCSPAP